MWVEISEAVDKVTQLVGKPTVETLVCRRLLIVVVPREIEFETKSARAVTCEVIEDAMVPDG